MTTLREKLSGMSGGRVLDVATEGGRFIDQLKDAFRNIDEVIGIDISDEGFDDARKRFEGDSVRFVVMDAANLEYPDESFDTVTMAAGMHHLDDVPAVLSQMMRVLKPGGTFVLREMYRDDQNEKQKTDVLQHDWYAKIDRLLGLPHHPTLTRRKIIEYVKALGLSRYESQKHLCEDCPRSKGETIENEISEMNEYIANVKGHPQYDQLVAERDRIVGRLRAVGISCQAALDVVGVK